jgi:hypothetical protein
MVDYDDEAWREVFKEFQFVVIMTVRVLAAPSMTHNPPSCSLFQKGNNVVSTNPASKQS